MLIKILRAAVSVPVNCNRQAETATLLERLVKSVTEENESEALHLCGPANPEAPKPLLPETLEPCCRVERSQGCPRNSYARDDPCTVPRAKARLYYIECEKNLGSRKSPASRIARSPKKAGSIPVRAAMDGERRL
jgi:hypothetical protein